MTHERESFLKELSPTLQKMVQKARILTVEEAVLSYPVDFLLQGYSSKDIYELKSAAAKLLSKKITPSCDLLNMPYCNQWSRLSFGCTALDRCTRGGIITRGITEICGASSVGKTQLLLQLSLMVQLPSRLGGLSGGVAFICTEDAFSSKRLFEMSKNMAYKYPTLNINYLANVHIERAHQSEQLIKCVFERLPKLMSSESISLIIIDSVAAMFRLYTNYIERARDMRKLANGLLNLINKYNCAVICVNQVANASNAINTELPCLGLSWAHLGRTRIRITKLPKQMPQGTQLLSVRKLEIMYSPETPSDSAEFLITTEGLIDVPSLN